MKNKTSAIYNIINIKNNKKYIGSTTSFETRFYKHLNLLKKNSHYNIHLQRAFNIDGESSFIFSMIELCDECNLTEREEYFIFKFNSCDCNFGYNMNPKCDRPPSWLGKKHKNETKIKIGLGNKGKKISDEQKKSISKIHKGKKISDEQKKLISIKSEGVNNPMFDKKPYDIWVEKYGKEYADKKLIEWKLNISEGNKGRITSDETKQKLRDLKLGKKLDQKTKDKIRQSKLGGKASEKTKKMMSDSRKGEGNPACKISDLDVVNIKKYIDNGVGVTELSKKYNVSRRTIYNIKDGKR